MPEMFTPSAAEWQEVQSWLADALARIKQVELFHAEMDGRQAKAEDTLTVHDNTLAGHGQRTDALESWRKSADATMVFTEKKILAVESELPKLSTAVSRLTDSVSRITTSLTTLTETVSVQISKLSTLEARIAACEEKLQPTEGGEHVSKRV